MSFVKFPSIGGLHNVVVMVEHYPHHKDAPISYRPKIKLHGTNASVRIRKDGVIVPQGRNVALTFHDDNMGFFKWIIADDTFWKDLASRHPDITVFGEWCGQGIMKGTAINQIGRKIFAVFAIMIDCSLEEDGSKLVTDPDEIRSMLGDTLPSGIYVLPWATDPIMLDFGDKDHLNDRANELSKLVDELEARDPWVFETFGVEGIAEGYVYYPFSNRSPIDYYDYYNLAFKAKGQKHKVVKMRQNVQVDPEVVATIDAFVSMFVTVPRLEQGLVEGSKGAADMSQIGPFLAWLVKDVEKESKDELAASGLAWSQVKRQVMECAKIWYLEKIRTAA